MMTHYTIFTIQLIVLFWNAIVENQQWTYFKKNEAKIEKFLYKIVIRNFVWTYAFLRMLLFCKHKKIQYTLALVSYFLNNTYLHLVIWQIFNRGTNLEHIAENVNKYIVI